MLLDGAWILDNPGPDVSVTTSAMVETTQQSDFSANALYASLELPNKALNFCHYNVCSLTNKLDEIKLLLSTFSRSRNGKPNLILGISETFLNRSWTDASLYVDNFNIHRLDHAANKGGELLVYVPLHLPINRTTELEVQGIECICLEILSLSDHLPVFVLWKSISIKSKVPGHKTITFRSTKNISVENILSDLDRVPWNTLEMFNDPNEALEQWYCLFNNVLDIHMAFKTRRVKI